MEIRKFIKTTIREYLNENDNYFNKLNFLKKLPKEINSEPVVFRYCDKKEINEILDGGNSGNFWTTEPSEYVEFGTHLIIAPINLIIELSSSQKNHDGSIQFVGGKINKTMPIVIIDKQTSKILYDNTTIKNKLNPFDDNKFIENLTIFIDKLGYRTMTVGSSVEYYNEEIYNALLYAKKTGNFNNSLLDKHSEDTLKICKFINNNGYDCNDFYIAFNKITLDN